MRLIYGCILLVTLLACNTSTPEPTSPEPATPVAETTAPAAPTEPLFREMATSLGVDFTHENGARGEFYYPEIMGSGVALFDYDNDGDLDLYLIQGHNLDPGSQGARPKDRLFRNDLRRDATGTPAFSFTDVTEESGIVADGYGMGAAIGDVDGDGWLDLYVLNFGSNQLWRNRGDGTFEEIVQRANADDTRWSVSGAFADYDQDGDQDLLIINYVDFTVANNQVCVRQVRDYCSPQTYRPVPDRLLRNRGDGTFEDVTADARLGTAYGSGLGVVVEDFDNDGLPDFYVANDGNPNQLWRNRGDGTFEDIALMNGAALNAMGAAEAGMGVDAGDVDQDGDMDLFMTHLKSETHTLYVNRDGFFEDRTVAAGLEAASKASTGFGAALVDIDNDGFLDVFCTNGDVAVIEALMTAGDPYPYGQRDQVFLNRGDGGFREVRDAGLVGELIGRGAAFGDVDNDGDLDVVVNNNGGPTQIYVNQHKAHDWLGLVLKEGERPAEQARVTATFTEGPTLVRGARRAASYGSANDVRVLLGLGADRSLASLHVRWSDGSGEVFPAPTPNQWITLTRGEGQAAEAPAVVTATAETTTAVVTTDTSVSVQPEQLPELILPDLRDQDAEVRALIETTWQSLQVGTVDSTKLGGFAMRAHAHGFMKPAEIAYRHALAAKPNDFRWRYYLAVTLRDQGDAGAPAAYRHALELDANHAPTNLALAEFALAENRTDDARRHYEAVRAKVGGHPAVLIGLGRVARLEGDLDAAIALLKQALQADPNASLAHYPLAQAYRAKGDVETAQFHLARRGNAAPAIADSLLNNVFKLRVGAENLRKQGEQAAQRRDWPAARALFAKAVARDPNNLTARLNLGEIERLMGERQTAQKTFREALQLPGPDGVKATLYRYIGEIHGELGEDDAAIDHLSKTLELDGGQIAAHFHLADAMRRQGIFGEAADHYQRVIDQIPNNAASRFGRLFALIGAADYDRARQAVQEDMRALPNEPSFPHVLARLLATANQPNGDQALSLLNGLNLYRDHALEASYAMAHAARGDFAQAVSTQESALAKARQTGQPAVIIDTLTRNLADYQASRPCKEPWPPEHPLVRRPTFRPQ